MSGSVNGFWLIRCNKQPILFIALRSGSSGQVSRFLPGISGPREVSKVPLSAIRREQGRKMEHAAMYVKGLEGARDFFLTF